MTDTRNVCYRLPMPVEEMLLAVEWVTEAEWDKHWAVILYSPENRDELSRRCTFTEAKKAAQDILQAVVKGQVA